MNKRVTAVEWLVEQLSKKTKDLKMELHVHCGEIIEQAKEMEKKQIIETYIAGSFTGCGCYDYMEEEDGELYYNETYKSE